MKRVKQNLAPFQISLINKYVFCILIILLISCEMKEQPNITELFGKWVLKADVFQVNYPILYFNTDSSSIFTSHGDTIYRFNYDLVNEYLYLKDIYGQETQWKILGLNDTLLVFESLFENRNQQIYRKEPNDVNNR